MVLLFVDDDCACAYIRAWKQTSRSSLQCRSNNLLSLNDNSQAVTIQQLARTQPTTWQQHGISRSNLADIELSWWREPRAACKLHQLRQPQQLYKFTVDYSLWRNRLETTELPLIFVGYLVLFCLFESRIRVVLHCLVACTMCGSCLLLSKCRPYRHRWLPSDP